MTMRLGRSLIDNPVYNIRDGRTLGKVEDLYLDRDLTTVTGAYLGGEGLLKRTPVFIRSKDVALFGVDAVLATSTAIVYRGDEIPTAGQWIRLRELQGRDVDTPGGTKIGRIRDVVLNADAQVTGLSLGQIAIEGPLAESKTVSRAALVDIGGADDPMTVDLATAERETVRIDPSTLVFGLPAEPLEREGEDVVCTPPTDLTPQ
jgi:sporulation protein YlmC with PRC-barrel domain